MYITYLQNDLIFSSIFGIISLIITFIESKRTKEKYSLKNYFKIFVCVTLCVYLANYVKSTSLLNFDSKKTSSKSSFGKNYSGGGSVNIDNYSNINIGDPDF
jgi:cytosine/uracil/thiamine/allantoin permease